MDNVSFEVQCTVHGVCMYVHDHIHVYVRRTLKDQGIISYAG